MEQQQVRAQACGETVIVAYDDRASARATEVFREQTGLFGRVAKVKVVSGLERQGERCRLTEQDGDLHAAAVLSRKGR
jgi:hypothetical protein